MTMRRFLFLLIFPAQVLGKGHSSNVIRGGGIFTDSVNIAESKSVEMTKMARTRASRLDDKASQLADLAWKQAQSEQKRLEKEASRFAKQAEKAAKRKMVSWENQARRSAAKLERAAKKQANKAAAAMEKAAKQRAALLEKSIQKRGDKIELSLTNFLLGSEAQPKSTIWQRLAAVALGFLILQGSVTSIMNLLGKPEIVIDHWEHTIFGAEFFPFDMSLTNKRLLAGAMEMVSVLMMATTSLRKYGAAFLGIMYSRGAWINSKIVGLKAASIAIGPIIAIIILFVNDML